MIRIENVGESNYHYLDADIDVMQDVYDFVYNRVEVNDEVNKEIEQVNIFVDIAN